MSTDFDIPAGTVLGGKYRVDRVLGRGGMGIVLAAHHLQLDQAFALKVMLPEYSRHPEAVARFLREARAAVRVRDEHVARVTDVGETDAGVPFMVMELLDGTDLEQLLSSRGPLPIQETVELVLQACSGVAEAHALGIVHRDLKPSNLFVTRRRDGTPLVKVLDFGISKALDTQGGSLTATSAMIGSPLYMSPEQVRTAKDVDARSDIWSLGAILYELLTGVAPFVADSASAVLARVVADDPAPLRELRPDIPLGLQELILACLRKNRDERPRSVAVLMDGLRPFAPSSVGRDARTSPATGPGNNSAIDSGRGYAAPAEPAPRTTGKPSRAADRRVLVALLGTVLAIAVALALFQWGVTDEGELATPAMTAPLPASTAAPGAALQPTSDVLATVPTAKALSEPAGAMPAPSTTSLPPPSMTGAPRKAKSRTPSAAERPPSPRRGDDLFSDPK